MNGQDHIDNYSEMLEEVKALNCDCDDDTGIALIGIIYQYPITQEQVEVLWALSKDVVVVRRAAEDLNFGFSFPDDDLAGLTEWVRSCRAYKDTFGFSAKQAAEALRALGKTGIAAAMAGHKLQKAMEKLSGITTKGKQDHGPARVRKKHVLKASDNTGLRPILSKSNRGGHVYQRRS